VTGDASAGAATPGQSYGWLLGVAALVLALDQLSKALIVHHMLLNESIPLLGPVVSLTRRLNTGGAFGVLQGNRVLLCLVSGAVAAGLIIMGPRLAGGSRAVLAGLGMVLGGAAGNLVDRVRLGHVVDFIDFHFWPVFNIADTAITVGALLIVVVLVISIEREERQTGTPGAP